MSDNRRDFIKKGAALAAALSVGGGGIAEAKSACSSCNEHDLACKGEAVGVGLMYVHLYLPVDVNGWRGWRVLLRVWCHVVPLGKASTARPCLRGS